MRCLALGAGKVLLVHITLDSSRQMRAATHRCSGLPSVTASLQFGSIAFCTGQMIWMSIEYHHDILRRACEEGASLHAT